MGCIEIYKSGGFDLVGFQSNSVELLKRLPSTHIKQDVVDLVDKSDSENIVKILGLHWSTSSDEFLFKLKFDKNFEKLMEGDVTKRRVLRSVMQIFDPLGFLSLCTVRGKFIIQQMWLSGSDWDSVASEKIQISWAEFVKELQSITNVRIPRQFVNLSPSSCKVQLLVFADASDIAYAAVAYLRFKSPDDDQFKIAIAMAKSKVAPLKYLSVPRLELNAALIGTRISTAVKNLVNFEIHETKFFSDSKTVLSWIKSTEYKFKPFVAARVGEILESTIVDQWQYVPSKENVADDATKWKGRRGQQNLWKNWEKLNWKKFHHSLSFIATNRLQN
jgi:Pao retrotransposon peptidase